MTDTSDSVGVSTNQPEANAMAVKKTAGTANRWSSEVAPLLVSSTSERGNSDEDMRIPPTGVDDALNSGLYSSESESQHLKRTQVRLSVQEFAREDGVVLSLPGSGNTWERFEVLASWAADDLSVGRLVEGHSDALAILAEAGTEPVSREATYGVWAARTRSPHAVRRLATNGLRPRLSQNCQSVTMALDESPHGEIVCSPRGEHFETFPRVARPRKRQDYSIFSSELLNTESNLGALQVLRFALGTIEPAVQCVVNAGWGNPHVFVAIATFARRANKERGYFARPPIGGPRGFLHGHSVGLWLIGGNAY